MAVNVSRIDSKMYLAGLTYYGLPREYNRTFKQKHTFNYEQTEAPPAFEQCQAVAESGKGFAIWVQANLPRKDTAFDESGTPRVASIDEMETIQNVTLCLDSLDPSTAQQIGIDLAFHLEQQGMAREGLPIIDSGTGFLIVLPISPIKATAKTAQTWNDAIAAVVKKYILPEVERLTELHGIQAEPYGYGIDQLLPIPGTWQPNQDNPLDGSLCCWLSPYGPGNYPARYENKRLSDLIKTAYKQLVPGPAKTTQPIPKPLLEALETLRPGKQWVCYTYPDKIPYSPGSGKRAKADDPATWGTYEQAQARLTLYPGKYAGIGYELLKEQGLTGVDLDNCIDEQGTLSSFAQDVIKRLNSYTEITPSTRGIRVWVYGSIDDAIAPHKPKPDGIEIYDHGRYFTVTGNHYPGTPTTIEQRQEELTAVYTEVVERRQAAKQRPAPVSKSGTAPGGDTPYCLKALEDECQQLAATGSGARNDQLNTSAFNMGRYVAGYGISRSTVERELFSACVQNGLVKEDEQAVRSTLRSGIEAGMKQPKSVPERLVEYKPSKHAATANNGNGNGNGNHNGNNGATQASGNALPEVIIAGQLRDYTAAALDALRLSEQQEHTLFVQSATLVKIGHDEKKRPIILHIGIAELRNALTRSANYYRLKEKNDEWIPVEIAPPKDLAEAILGLNPQEWPFPALEAIVETPVLRPDGTILDTPGYDVATRLYYMPSSSMQACKVPAHPTQTDIDQALALLIDAIGEFPYVSEADKANALALLMTPLVRPAIKRHIPLALIDAPKAGTGKGLLADTVALIATGNSASNLTAPDDDDEWDKRITAMLMQGRSIICIDNLKGMLQSAALDSTLTSDEKEGRVLGYSKMVKVANRATWLATGNNIKLGGDLARRCYRIRLDPQVSRPWMRTGFRHDDLATWVLEHRAELIGAILTLARAWFLAGKPLDPQVPALGTFTNWARMLGGILKFIGISDFLGNLEKLYQETDEDSTQWEAFLQAWHEHFGEAAVKISEVIKVLSTETVAGSAEKSAGSVFLDTLPEALQISLKDKPQSFAIRLGKALERRVDTRFGSENLCLKKEFDTNAKQKKWRVVAGSAGSPTTHARSKSEQTSFFEKEENKNNINSNGYTHYPHYPQMEDTDMPQAGSPGAANGIPTPVESHNILPATLPATDTEAEKRKRRGRILAANPRQPGESQEAYNKRIDALLSEV